jgi:SAM-dependent methyltransferase
MYTHILQSLAQSYAPKARSAIVFGLGAGIVPRNFSRRGLEVAVVEINPMALLAAREHFGFRADGIDVVLEDARTHARNCRSAYDIGILDLFQGDSVPDYLLTKEFFADLKGCLKPDGVLVMNTTFNPDDDEPNFRLMATIASAFPGLYVSGFLDGNIFIVGRSVAKEVELKVADTPIPKEIESHVRFAVSQSKLVPAEVYRHARPISDDHNIFSVLFSDTDMAERSYMVGSLPPAILVN